MRLVCRTLGIQMVVLSEKAKKEPLGSRVLLEEVGH